MCTLSIQRCSIDDDAPSFTGAASFIENNEAQQGKGPTTQQEITTTINIIDKNNGKETEVGVATTDNKVQEDNAKEVVVKESDEKKVEGDGEGPVIDLSRRLSRKWSTGAGPRIGCVRDYPGHLQSRALEQVNLSPRPNSARLNNYGPIPSPRPSPKVRMSPSIAYMGLPSPRTPITLAC